MENTDSNPKSQTGGLKLMTVFILVLALHVLVIGGFTIYHLVSGGSTDADIVTDKPHKSMKVTPDSAGMGDVPIADAGDKSPNAAPAANSSDSANAPMTIPAAASDNSTVTVPSTDTPAPNTPIASTVPPTPAPPASAQPTTTTPPAPTSADASGPVASNGPVINPPAGKGPETAKPETTPTQLDASSGTGSMTYTVKSHDSLARIAHRHHVSMAKLKSLNGLKNDFVHAGEKLTIPEKSPETSTGLARLREPNTTMLGDDPMPGEKMPASKHEKIASITHEKSTSSAPVSGRHVYTVIKGDTLSRIAHRFHTSANAIMTLNNIGDARKLRLGQKLKIPSQESRSATSTPTPARAPEPDKIEPRATPSAQLANFID